MNVGFVSKGPNGGQGAVTRSIRSIFDEAGHNTFLLARPFNPKMPIGEFVNPRGEWVSKNVTQGSTYNMPPEEYVGWAKRCRLDTLFCDMNLQFEAIEAVRRSGVRTIGRFVWERFRGSYAEAVKSAYDVVYSLTRCEQLQYEEFGIESFYLRFGLSPAISAISMSRRTDGIYFIFHAGLQGPRKPLRATVEAFKAVREPNIHLIIKSQAIRENSEQIDIEDDRRIEHIVRNLSYHEYHELFASCHVCLATSRWEGLGVHLFESLAHGMPVIANDIPPVNEVICHGRSGLLVRSIPSGSLPNGLTIYDPDPGHLRECIEELADPDRLASLFSSTRAEASKDRFRWEDTRKDYLALAAGEALPSSAMA